MFRISAHELKQGGLTAIKKLLKKSEDIIVQERGKDACVIVDLKYYEQLRLCELEVAYLNAKEDIKSGNFKLVDDVEGHVNRVLAEIDLENKHK